jgi:hypothetical protein
MSVWEKIPTYLHLWDRLEHSAVKRVVWDYRHFIFDITMLLIVSGLNRVVRTVPGSNFSLNWNLTLMILSERGPQKENWLHYGALKYEGNMGGTYMFEKGNLWSSNVPAGVWRRDGTLADRFFSPMVRWQFRIWNLLHDNLLLRRTLNCCGLFGFKRKFMEGERFREGAPV